MGRGWAVGVLVSCQAVAGAVFGLEPGGRFTLARERGTLKLGLLVYVTVSGKVIKKQHD